MNSSTAIFGKNSVVHLLNPRVFDYNSLVKRGFINKLDVPLLESVRDWSGETEVSERLIYLSKALDIPRVKYMEMPWNTVLSNTVAKNGDLEVLEYIHSKGCKWDLNTFSFAAGYGNLDCVEYLSAHNCPYEEGVLARAIVQGELDCVKFLIEHHQNEDYNFCGWAAEGNHVEILKHLQSANYKWDERTCEAAASRNNLACLVYAHTHGCPWNERTFRYCVDSFELTNRADCADYAFANDCPSTDSDRKRFLQLKNSLLIRNGV